jgi:YVTN family beta-propeller protein
MTELPSGTVTFLFTDIEGSTRLLKRLRDRYGDALADHQRIVRQAFENHDGREIDTQGDSFFVAFGRAKDAVAAAADAQRGLAGHAWPESVELRVRMGIHTAEPTVGEDRYVGLGVHRGARICAAGHGGQVLVSQTSRELLRDDPLPDVSLRDLGPHQLKDLDEPEQLYQLVAPGLRDAFPPLKTAGSTPFAGREGELGEAAADKLGRDWRRGRIGLIAAGVVAAVALAAGGVLLLSDPAPSQVTAIVKANAVGTLDSESGTLASQVPVGAAPTAIAADRAAIWVTSGDDQSVSQIDPQKQAVVQTIRVGAGAAGVAIGAGAVWVANALDGTVSRIDPETRTIVDTITVGSSPTAIAYGLDALWIVNRGDGTVVKLGPRTGKVGRPLTGAPDPTAIATGFGSLWVTNRRTGTITRIHPKTGVVEGTINVGNGPVAVASGAGSVWVANNLDGTVSRIDPRTNTATTNATGRGPSGVAAGPHTVWVANEDGASLTRIDPETGRPVGHVKLGNRPNGVALVGDSLVVAVRGRGLAHRGGTLRVSSGRRGLKSIDPSLSYETYTFAIPGLTRDGLVAFKHVGGSDGSTLVADLARSIQVPTDAGKSYTFEVRRGIRYSTGRVVRAEDFRRAIERTFKLESLGGDYYAGIIGAARCKAAPKSCDLSRGIQVDNSARLITFRLAAPDPDFLYKLALPYATAVPPGAPDHDVRTRPLPGTGPYKIARYIPKRELLFVRNPYFRQWSEAARPAAYPDRIVWRLDVPADSATRATEEGRADVAYDFVSPKLLNEAKTQHASQLHVDPIPGTYFYFFDQRRRPFNDVRVRRAVNYAIDRKQAIELARGAEVAAPTCQVLPPNFPGFRPYCPYTASPSANGSWTAPDLARARRLVAASGTKGQLVKVWAAEQAEGAYIASVLRQLGYRTRLKTVTPFDKYTDAIFDPRAKVQIAALRWFSDYPAASGFINSVIFDCSYFCDRRIERLISRARARQATNPRAANALWTRIDRELTDAAPWLFLYNNKQADFVSRRVRNFQYNLQYGILLDQLQAR